MEEKLLEVRKLTKVFPGTVALDEMDFELFKGEVRAVVGENGAGKSTLMKILSGAYTKTSGQILFDGKEVNIQDVEDSMQLGVSMIYQELENITKLSVAENIFLGRLPRRALPFIVNFKKLYADAALLLEEYGISIDPKAKLHSLSVAQQQFVEIIKAVTIKNARIIIMDEPTSSLTREETDKLFLVIQKLKQRGISIIYISHRLDEIAEVADAVDVFRDGKNRGSLRRGDFDTDRIITLMVGHSVEGSEKPGLVRDKVVFEVRNLNIKNRIRDFKIELFEGEILGIAGLMGSGKDELVKSLFGLWPAQSGEIYYRGRRIYIKHPAQAIDLGIVYLPEERKLQSLFLELSVRENISAIWMYQKHRGLLVDARKEQALAAMYIKQLEIKASSASEDILGLSGGNQQKAIFSRLLAAEPSLMILNDPTRGVDIKSKEAIYDIIKMMVAKGTSVLFLSSEIPEISYLANRVVVLSKGVIRGEFRDADVTTRNILTCAASA